MKKYISPEFEAVTINTKDIMDMSGNAIDDGTSYDGAGVNMQSYIYS